MTICRSVEIDLGTVNTKEEIHERLASALGFPDYYGRNWDAFDECMQDLTTPPSQIRISGVATLETRLPREARLLKQCFQDFGRSERGRGIVIEIP